MSRSKLVCLKLFMPLVLSLAIPEVLCLSMWSPPHGLVGSTGGGGERRKEHSTFIYILFLGQLNASLWSLPIS